MNKRSLMSALYVAVCGSLLTFFLQACGPTYPAHELENAVKRICFEEYGLKVEAERVGGTLGIYYAREGLLNMSFGIRESAWEDINNLLLAASRVLLSTDAEVNFYCVIAQDVHLPEIQVVVIKYVEDVKMTMYRAISRGESFRRTLFSHNLTPQAQKERPVEEVFDKMRLDEEMREAILNEFFRSQPTTLEDIGYWRGSFYLKDVTMEEFLAAQIANRVKLKFLQDEPLPEKFHFQHVEGEYRSRDGKTDFYVSFRIAPLQPVDDLAGIRSSIVREVLEEASKVLDGYKFDEFDELVLFDQRANAQLTIRAEDVRTYQGHPVPVKEIVSAPPGYF